MSSQRSRLEWQALLAAILVVNLDIGETSTSNEYIRPPCGLVPLFPNQPPVGSHRIFLGQKAKVGQWPFIAFIMNATDVGPTLSVHTSCSGTVIDRHWILTAAHCVPENATADVLDKYYIDLGRYNLRHDDMVKEGDRIESYKVSKVFRHPDFNTSQQPEKGNTPDHDIGLIKLTKPIEFNDHVQPICLANKNALYSSFRDIRMLGYGHVQDGEFAVNLNELPLEVLSWDKCQKEFSYMPVNHLCFRAKPPKTGGPCYGDSGGPVLFYEPTAAHWEQIGVMSFTKTNCSQHNRLIGFADISLYKFWVQKIIFEN